jgi:hypothetical protein
VIQKLKKLQKLNLLIQFKAIHGEIYIRTIIKRINVAKEIFIMNIELGLETFIPKVLSQDHLPVSFRFYDPILHIVTENCSEEMK